jgi:predicted RNase H-like HicB family nuclease
MLAMKTLIFQVSTEDGVFLARWDDPQGGGIATEGNSLSELQEMIEDAVQGYFHGAKESIKVVLHFADDPVLMVAA